MYKGTENFYNAATTLVKAFAYATNKSQNTVKLAIQIVELKEYAEYRKMVNEQAVTKYFKEVVYAQEREYVSSIVEYGNAMTQVANCVLDCNHAIELLSQPSYYGQNLLKADGDYNYKVSDLVKVQEARQFAAIA